MKRQVRLGKLAQAHADASVSPMGLTGLSHQCVGIGIPAQYCFLVREHTR